MVPWMSTRIISSSGASGRTFLSTHIHRSTNNICSRIVTGYYDMAKIFSIPTSCTTSDCGCICRYNLCEMANTFAARKYKRFISVWNSNEDKLSTEMATYSSWYLSIEDMSLFSFSENHPSIVFEMASVLDG